MCVSLKKKKLKNIYQCIAFGDEKNKRLREVTLSIIAKEKLLPKYQLICWGPSRRRSESLLLHRWHPETERLGARGEHRPSRRGAAGHIFLFVCFCFKGIVMVFNHHHHHHHSESRALSIITVSTDWESAEETAAPFHSLADCLKFQKNCYWCARGPSKQSGTEGGGGAEKFTAAVRFHCPPHPTPHQ